jgi:amino-acid N-acetyltransferase
MHNYSALRRSGGDGAVVVSGGTSAMPTAESTTTAARVSDAAGAEATSASRALGRHVGRARAARLTDAAGIAELIARYTGDGTLLPRSVHDIEAAIDAFVVVTALDGRVLACAALQEYSPSLAEVTSVAVSAEAHGRGLGTKVVRAIEKLAQRRGHRELFALSLADRFFASMGYQAAPLTRYPEKLARYATLAADGVTLVPKRCFRKRVRVPRAFPRLVVNAPLLVSAPTVYHARPTR